MDNFDKKIIAELMLDGRLSISELANRIGLSKTPCQNRLKRLIDKGYILGFRAIVDHAKLEREMVAFTEVKMSDTRESALADFNVAVSKIPEVEQCHLIAGTFDYLLKIRTSDINQYRKVIAESISQLPHLASTSTYVSMQSIKDNG